MTEGLKERGERRREREREGVVKGRMKRGRSVSRVWKREGVRERELER
jgi:hypothetical protein